MNILITAANSAQAHRLKGELNTDNILLGDYMDLPAFMLVPGKMLRLPDPASVAYMHEMLTLCLDNNISTVYLFREPEIKLLMEAEQLFKEYNIEILIPGNEIQ
jgi:hypothetical protein